MPAFKKTLNIYRKNKSTATNDMANALRGHAMNLMYMGLKNQAREV